MGNWNNQKNAVVDHIEEIVKSWKRLTKFKSMLPIDRFSQSVIVFSLKMLPPTEK